MNCRQKAPPVDLEKVKKDIILLGLETSCDETAAAIVKNGRQVISTQLISQIDLHNQFGGVVPGGRPARRHVELLNQVVGEALSEARLSPRDLSGIVCTAGPGLIGTLLVGLAAAKTRAGRIFHNYGRPSLLARLCQLSGFSPEPPFIALLVSGGHTQILYCETFQAGKILGQTIDDAAGEAFDKGAGC